MKKLLLLLIAVGITFSCSEYSDDGTPGDIVITNPDGTKKIKSVTTSATGVASMDTGMQPTDMNITITTNRTYASDSYSNETEVYMNTSVAGMEGGESTLVSRLNETIDGVKITKIASLTMDSLAASRTNYTFDYNGDQLSGFNYTTNGIALGNGTITATGDQITSTVISTSENFVPVNWVFSLTDSLITSAIASNVTTGTEFNVDFTRTNGNITGINIASAATSNFTYTYDSNINPLHQVYTDNLDRTNAEIVRLISGGFQDQAGGSSIDISNLEAILRGILIEGNNNLLTANSGSQLLEQRSYTYDEEDYPVAMTSQLTYSVDLSGSLTQYLAQLEEMLAGMGMSPEEITAMLAELQAGFEGRVDVELEQDGTITYYE